MKRLIAAAMCMLIVNGCSIVAVSGPPRNHANLRSVECTSHNEIPATDGILAGTGLGVAAYLGAKDDDAPKEAIGAAAIAGTLFAVSALIGLDRTKKCRAAKARLAARDTWLLPEPTQPPRKAAYRDSRAVSGCAYDTQCKGNRVCISGQCIEPPRAPTPAEDTVPAEETAPAEHAAPETH